MTDRFGRFLALSGCRTAPCSTCAWWELGYAEALVIRPNRNDEELFWQALC